MSDLCGYFISCEAEILEAEPFLGCAKLVLFACFPYLSLFVFHYQ